MADGWNIITHHWLDDNDMRKPERSNKEPFIKPLFPIQIPRGLPWEGTRANAISSR